MKRNNGKSNQYLKIQSGILHFLAYGPFRILGLILSICDKIISHLIYYYIHLGFG